MSPEASRAGLLLVGHGSHLSARTAEPVLALSRAFEARGAFREVREAFWKEEPSLRDALDLMPPGPVVVLPVFLADGYFTRTVVPRELGLAGALASGRDVRVAAPLGTHPDIARLVRIRAGQVDPPGTPAAGTALVVVGHGTPRARTSGGTVRSVVRALGAGGFGLVTCAFLDQEPGLEEVLACAGAARGIERITVVPFFMAGGWHAGTTLPADLAVVADSGVPVRVTHPVGTLPEVDELALDLVLAALQEAPPVHRAGPAPAASGQPCRAAGPSGPSGGPLDGARTALKLRIDSAGADGVDFMQVRLQSPARDRYTARHVADVTRSPGDLVPLEGARPGVALGRTRGEGLPRPLRSAPDLDRGWILEGCTWSGLCSFLDDLHPLAVLRWFEGRTGTLQVTRFPETAARQSGLLADVGNLSVESLMDLVDDVCQAGCLREPAWPPGGMGPGRHRSPGTLTVPCREACSVFLSAAAERAPVTMRPAGPVPAPGN